jgi:hypothetical protein
VLLIRPLRKEKGLETFLHSLKIEISKSLEIPNIACPFDSPYVG